MPSTAAILAYPDTKVPAQRRDPPQVTEARDDGEPKFRDEGTELFRKLRSWIEEGRDQTGDWRANAERYFDLTAGWQWSPEDQKILDDDNRPTVTFNRIGRNIDLISGMEVQGREEVAFLPREEGDVGKSEVLSSAVQYITDETDANDEKSDAFRDLCICGLGWTNTVMDYRDYPQGMPCEIRIDPLEMYWDPSAKRRNLRDSKWRARARCMPLAEAMRMFPDQDEAVLSAAWLGVIDDPTRPSEPDRQSYNYEDGADRGHPQPTDRVVVVEIQWWEEETHALVEDLYTGERKEMKAERARKAMQMWPGRYEAIERPNKVFYRAFLGDTMLNKEKLEKVQDFTFQPQTGKRDRKAGWYGLVRLMEDPQRWANKWLSQSMHIMNTNGKGSLFYETGAFVDAVKSQRNAAKPGAWHELEDGAIDKIREVAPTPLPPELGQHLLPFALTSIQDCVGIQDEMLGTVGQNAGNNSAILEEQRREAGVTMLAFFFDSKRLFVKRQGRLLLRYIMSFMNDGRLIRTLNEDQHRYVPMLFENPDDVEYDIIVDEAPDSPNQRGKTWNTIMQLMPLIEKLLEQMPGHTKPIEKMLHASPLPASVKTSLSEGLQQAGQQAQQQQQKPDPAEQLIPAQIQKIMAEVQKLGAQTEELKSQILLNMAKARETGQRVELDALENVRETVALNDAREMGKMTAHENA
jgi:hypothetical protein